MPNNNNNIAINMNQPMLAQQQDADFKHLVLAGGGAKGALYPGALKALEHIGVLKNIQTVAGSSAGALTSAMLAIGLTSDEIDEQFKTKSFADFLKTTKLTEGGAFSVGSLKRHVNEVLYTHLAKKLKGLYEQHKDVIKNRADREFLWQLQTQLATTNRARCTHPTFNDLARLAKIFDGLDKDKPHPFKELVVTMTEYEPGSKEGKTVYCKADETGKTKEFGDRPIAEVVACSACLPIVFAPVTMYGKVYRDGGIYDNTPIKGIPEEEHDKTLALVFEDSSLAHEQAIFSKDEPVLAEAQLSDKVIKTAFDASLPHCIFNDANTVRKHAANIVRLIVPEGLDVATMKLTPELAAKATINGFMSVMTWAKAFYPSRIITEEIAHPDVSSDDSTLTSTLSKTLHAQLEKQKGFLKEKERLLEEISILTKEKDKLQRTDEFIQKHNLTKSSIDKKIKQREARLNINLAGLDGTDKNLKIIEKELSHLSSRLLETKAFARHFLTSQILAWKKSIEKINPIFRTTLDLFIDEVYVASKNIDDGKFFADNIDKISNLLNIFSDETINMSNVINKFAEITDAFFKKEAILEQFNYRFSMVLSNVADYNLLSELKAQATRLQSADLKMVADDLIMTLERAMTDVYQHHYDREGHHELLSIINGTNTLFNNISSVSIKAKEETVTSSTLDRSNSCSDLSALAQPSPTTALKETQPSSLSTTTLSTKDAIRPSTGLLFAAITPAQEIAAIQFQVVALRSKIFKFATTREDTIVNAPESKTKNNKLLRAFDRFSQAVTRFFSATVAAVKPSNFGLWRRQPAATTEGISGSDNRPAAAA